MSSLEIKKSKQLPLSHALGWIVGVTLVFSSISYKVLQVCIVKKGSSKERVDQMVCYIVQTGMQREALHSDYIAELLDLSSDHPKLFSAFDEEAGKKLLLKSPVIKEASIKKIPPNMLYVDYTVRKPEALLANFSNIAVDKEGYVFPLTPL